MRQQVGEVVILQGVGTGEVQGKRGNRFGQHAGFGNGEEIGRVGRVIKGRQVGIQRDRVVIAGRQRIL